MMSCLNRVQLYMKGGQRVAMTIIPHRITRKLPYVPTIPIIIPRVFHFYFTVYFSFCIFFMSNLFSHYFFFFTFIFFIYIFLCILYTYTYMSCNILCGHWWNTQHSLSFYLHQEYIIKALLRTWYKFY